ncbi:MAG: endonuclease [Streptosporangiaceae bacterium]|nr:endonuclease [Streptosporangiaceae bacterium]
MSTSPRRRKSLEERFWSKVDKAGPDDCWPWNRSRTEGGYGQFKVRAGASPQKASRVAWALVHGPIPEGLVVCHRCDNPPCCNPAHLFLGTIADNNADKITKGRQAETRPELVAVLVSRVRRLSNEQIDEVRRLHATGQSCRTIARRFDVHHTTIVRLTNGTHWRRQVDAA